MAQNWDVWATSFPLWGHLKEDTMDSPSPFSLRGTWKIWLRLASLVAIVSLPSLPSDLLSFESPSPAEPPFLVSVLCLGLWNMALSECRESFYST